MLGVQYHARGNTRKVRGMVRRAGLLELETHCFRPFENWVVQKRIPLMYWQKGRVTGTDAQPVWLALSKWTIASKGVGHFISGAGARGSTLSPMVTSAMKMARSYVITHLRSSATVFRFEMTNTARSISKWSPGFDYPSALHTGWGPYTVRPRADGPGFLAWPTRKGSVIGASMGRASSHESLSRSGAVRGAKKGKTLTVAADWMRAMVTHPSGAPAREHIKFFAIDAIALGRKVLDYVFRGVVA